MGDIATQDYPWWRLAQRTVAAGRLPLWNRHTLLGFPLLANSQSAVLYPPRALLYALGPLRGWAWAFPLRTLLASLFAALAARRLGASTAGAIVAGAAYGGCGFMVGWQGWAHADSAVWLPAAVLAVEHLTTRPSGRAAVATAAVLATAVLAGHPEVALYVWLVAAVWAVAALAWPGADGPRGRDRLRALALAGVACLGGAALAGAQILPTLEWLARIARPAAGYHFWSLQIEMLIGIVLRDTHGAPATAGLLVPPGSIYVGLLTLAAAPLALLHRRRRPVGTLFVLALASFGVAYGLPPLYRWSQAVPLLGALPNDRLVLVLDLALALAGGLGLTALGERATAAAGGRDGRLDLALHVGFLAPLVGLVVVAGIPDPPEVVDPGWMRGRASAWVFYGAAVLLLAAIRLRPLAGAVLAPAAAVLVVLEMASFAAGHVPAVPPAAAFPEPPCLEFLRRLDAGPHRVTSVDWTLPGNVEMMFDTETAGGYEYALIEAARLIAPFTTGNPFDFTQGEFRAARVVAAGDRRLDLMNVRYLVATSWNDSAPLLAEHPERFREVYAEDRVHVFQNLDVLPRAFLVPAAAAEVEPSVEAALDRLADPAFDPARRVLVGEELPPEAAGPASAATGLAGGRPGEAAEPATGEVEALHLGTNDVRVRGRGERPAVLVLSELAYPGWRVRVDGAPARLLRVDGVLRGAALAPGEHEVVFEYRPASFRVGLGASCLALLVAGAAVTGGRRPRHAAPLARAADDRSRGRSGRGGDRDCGSGRPAQRLRRPVIEPAAPHSAPTPASMK